MAPVFDRLLALLMHEQARFRLIEHSAEGRSEEVARIRGTSPEQGAKAMLCVVPEMPDRLLLAVLPGNLKLDMRKLAAAIGGKRAKFAERDYAENKTDCVMGSVPPFALSEDVVLVADSALVNVHADIAFNAGRLDRSIVLNTEDYLRIARPLVLAISQAKEQ